VFFSFSLCPYFPYFHESHLRSMMDPLHLSFLGRLAAITIITISIATNINRR